MIDNKMNRVTYVAWPLIQRNVLNTNYTRLLITEKYIPKRVGKKLAFFLSLEVINLISEM